MEWLRHAFAMEPTGPATPNEAQRELVDRLCREVVRRRMTGPAHIALEMGRPLNYLSAQLLHFFEPFITVMADPTAYGHFSSFLEKRGSVEYVSNRLDAIESGVSSTGPIPGHRDAH